MFAEPYIPEHMLYMPSKPEVIASTDDFAEEPLVPAKIEEVTADEEEAAVEEEADDDVVIIAKRSAQKQQEQIDRNQLKIVDYYQQQLAPEQRQVLSPAAYVPVAGYQYAQVVQPGQVRGDQDKVRVLSAVNC